MHRKILASLMLATGIGLAGCAQNNGMAGMDMDHGDTASAQVIPANAVDLKNTICPVSGDKVGESKLFAVYEGKVYHFCCSDCPKDFAKDPAKYAKLVAADPAKYGVK